MNTILIERDVEHYADYDRETCSYKTVKTVHEQHVVDLDKAAFTCNSSIGYTINSKNAPLKLIRGIILPGRSFTGFRDACPENFESGREVLIESLEPELRKKIYSLFDEKSLYDVWFYVILPLAQGNSWYHHSLREFCEKIHAMAQYYMRKDIPLMLSYFTSWKRFPVEKDGKTFWIERKPTRVPLLIQPGAFIGISDDKHKACTSYGNAVFLNDCDWNYCDWEYRHLVFSKLEGFRK